MLLACTVCPRRLRKWLQRGQGLHVPIAHEIKEGVAVVVEVRSGGALQQGGGSLPQSSTGIDHDDFVASRLEHRANDRSGAVHHSSARRGGCADGACNTRMRPPSPARACMVADAGIDPELRPRQSRPALLRKSTWRGPHRQQSGLFSTCLPLLPGCQRQPLVSVSQEPRDGQRVPTSHPWASSCG